MAYYKKRRRRSGANIAQTIAGVLVAFLIIGLLGYLFAPRSETLKDPTEPTEIVTATDPTEAPTVELITFTYFSDEYQVESGTTFQEWIDSGAGGYESAAPYYPDVDANGIVTTDAGDIYLNGSGDPIKVTDVIISGGSYSPM